MYPKRTIPQDVLDSDAFAARFWAKVDSRDPITCWPYTGCRNEHGYGRFAISGGQWQYAHRVAWAITHKANAPTGLRVLHACDNRPCCNPAHLFLGTQADNVRDMAAKDRQKSLKGSWHPGAKLTEEAVLDIRQRCRDGEQQTRLAAEYGVSPSAIQVAVKYRSWKHVD